MGFDRSTVGHRVRRESGGRTQPDPAGRQLRLADGRRSRRHTRTHQPRNPVGHRRSVALRARLLRRLIVRVAALRGQRLIQVPVEADGAPGEPASLFTEAQYGRLRTVAAAPDGTLWFTTSNRDGPRRARETATTASFSSGPRARTAGSRASSTSLRRTDGHQPSTTVDASRLAMTGDYRRFKPKTRTAVTGPHGK